MWYRKPSPETLRAVCVGIVSRRSTPFRGVMHGEDGRGGGTRDRGREDDGGCIEVCTYEDLASLGGGVILRRSLDLACNALEG